MNDVCKIKLRQNILSYENKKFPADGYSVTCTFHI